MRSDERISDGIHVTTTHRFQEILSDGRNALLHAIRLIRHIWRGRHLRRPWRLGLRQETPKIEGHDLVPRLFEGEFHAQALGRSQVSGST